MKKEHAPHLQLYTRYAGLNVGFARQQKFAGHLVWHLNGQSCWPRGLWTTSQISKGKPH